MPKIAGVHPVARRYVPRDAWYATLLMSTGLTFGTIPSLYGLNVGIIDQAQFSVLVTVVVLTAILPTILAQRWFTPPEAIGGPGRGGADAIYREAYQLVLHLPGLQRVVDLLADVSELVWVLGGACKYTYFRPPLPR